MALAAKPLDDRSSAGVVGDFSGITNVSALTGTSTSLIGSGSPSIIEYDESKAFNFQCMPVRKFTIRLKSSQKSARNVGKSFVWEFFGDLCYNGIFCDPRRYYCNLCLEKAKQEARVNAAFDSFYVKKYQTNVSTSNYAGHLRVSHGVQAVAKPKPPNAKVTQNANRGKYQKRSAPRSNKRQVTRFQIEDGRAIETSVATLHGAQIGDVGQQQQQQQQYGCEDGGDVNVVGHVTLVEDHSSAPAITEKDLVNYFVRDIMPLDVVGYSGFQEILHKLGMNCAENETASVARLRSSLLEMHSSLSRYVREVLIPSASLGGCITVSKWSDVAGRYSFTSFVYHFVTEDFRFEHVCLRVVSSLTPLRAENLAQEIQRTLQLFHPDCDHSSKKHRQLFVVRDWCDGDMQLACQQLGVASYRCIGHILNNLLIANGLQNVIQLRHLFNKCLLVIRTLNLGAESLMMAIPDQFYQESLLEVGSLDDILVAENLLQFPRNATMMTMSSRWHVTLTILETFLKNKNVIDVLLEQLQNVDDAVLDEDEWRSLAAVHNFLATFSDAVDILVGNCGTANRSYPTLNLVLLFRSHLQLQLELTKGDHPFINHIKSCILNSFAEQFPVDEHAILAALLDPRLRDLTIVNDFFNTIKKEKSQFLCEAILKHDIVANNDAVGAGIFQSVDGGASLHHRTVYASPIAMTASGIDQSNGGVGGGGGGISCANSKRTKLSIKQLAKQYSGVVATTSDRCDSIGDEVANLLSQPPEAVIDDDILQFWNRKKDEWPILATLARCVFSLPATSARTADLFDKQGLLRMARRCSISPTLMDKVIFVGENCCYFSK